MHDGTYDFNNDAPDDMDVWRNTGTRLEFRERRSAAAWESDAIPDDAPREDERLERPDAKKSVPWKGPGNPAGRRISNPAATAVGYQWMTQKHDGSTTRNASPTMTSKESPAVSHDEIARLAYLNWEKDGRPFGNDQKYWLEAEQQIRATGMLLVSELSRDAIQPPAAVKSNSDGKLKKPRRVQRAQV
jgi:Protein of unknown function (DUF2934)